jgi:hypothetical protein
VKAMDCPGLMQADCSATPGSASVAEAAAAVPPSSWEDGSTAAAESCPTGKAGKTGCRKNGGRT